MEILVKKWFSQKIGLISNKVDIICIRKITEKAILVQLESKYDFELNYYYMSNYCSTYFYKEYYSGIWIPKSVILTKISELLTN